MSMVATRSQTRERKTEVYDGKDKLVHILHDFALIPDGWHERDIVAKLKDGKIAYSDKYSMEDVQFACWNFLTSWYGSSVLRDSKITLIQLFDKYAISALSSAKKNETYVLYRGLRFKNKNEALVKELKDGTYKEEYPTSWSEALEDASFYADTNNQLWGRYLLKANYRARYGVVVKATMNPEDILIDCSMLKRWGHDEIIALPNTFKVEIIKEFSYKAK